MYIQNMEGYNTVNVYYAKRSTTCMINFKNYLSLAQVSSANTYGIKIILSMRAVRVQNIARTQNRTLKCNFSDFHW